MIGYKFYVNHLGVPQFDVAPPFDGLCELGSIDNINEVNEQLRLVIQGTKQKCDFGYEVYVVECTNKECQIINTYKNWQVEAVVSTLEIYELMKTWKEFVEKNRMSSTDCQ